MHVQRSRTFPLSHNTMSGNPDTPDHNDLSSRPSPTPHRSRDKLPHFSELLGQPPSPPLLVSVSRCQSAPLQRGQDVSSPYVPPTSRDENSLQEFTTMLSKTVSWDGRGHLHLASPRLSIPTHQFHNFEPQEDKKKPVVRRPSRWSPQK